MSVNVIVSKIKDGPPDHLFIQGVDKKMFIKLDGFVPTDIVFVGIGQGSPLAMTDVFNWEIDVKDVPVGEYFLRVRKNNEREIGFVVYVKNDDEASDYTTLVSSSERSWKNRFDPRSQSVAIENGNLFMNPRMGSADGSMRITKFKIYIPAGTMSFQATSYLYIDNNMTPAIALVKFGSPPITEDVAHEGSFTSMAGLLGGSQFKFTSPQASLKLTPDFEGNFKVDKGDYLYVHLISAPGGIMMELSANLEIDYEMYQAWYAAAGFAEDGSPL